MLEDASEAFHLVVFGMEKISGFLDFYIRKIRAWVPGEALK
jgi:hypothetical protein